MATYNVEYMRDLFLTGRTRVFKIALFLLDEAALEGWVSDLQARGPDIADFFLTTFLGCRLTSDPSVVTRTFHLAAEKFINEIVSDPETKVRYETALLAQLNSNDKEISLNTFANKYLDTKDRAPFVKDLAAAGVTTSFVKDTQLISKKLRKLQYEFSQGVKVTYPADIPEDVVHVSAQTDGRTAMKIVDELKNLHTRT